MLRAIFQVPFEYFMKWSFLKPTFKKEELKDLKAFPLILTVPRVFLTPIFKGPHSQPGVYL